MSKNIQSYFKDYPGRDKCYETADGIIFHEKGDANMHQSETLKSKEPVKVHYRSNKLTEVETIVPEPPIGSEITIPPAVTKREETAKASKKSAPKKSAPKKTDDKESGKASE
ncbi:hypothetical protein ABDK00_016910 [Niabella insulamsoli]|uniref:hypothetical protein n=1 Tax=Niabella insulamsoli TaxID=3144874 RepID=UPI0031FD11A9